MRSKYWLVILLILVSRMAIGQSFRVATGFGIPDLYHLEVAYRPVESFETSIQMGTLLESNPNNYLFSSSVGYKYLFGKAKKVETRHPWFVSTRLNLNFQETGSTQYYLLLWQVGIGRDHYISERFGFSWEAGPVYSLLEREYLFTDLAIYESRDVISDFLPGFRVQFFYFIGRDN